MPNDLKMPKKSHVLALLELGWSYRRIEAETGVRRETVSRYDRMRRANAAKTFPGSGASPPTDSTDSAGVDDPNAAKTFAGSDAKPARATMTTVTAQSARHRGRTRLSAARSSTASWRC